MGQPEGTEDIPPALITNRALLGEPPLSAMQIDELVDAVMLPANPRPQSPHPRDHHHDIEVYAMTTVADMAGAQWSISAINETMMTINTFTVVTVAFLALAKIARGDTTTPCQ